MELYKQAFGKDYQLGIRIPDYFEDQSYRNDSGPSFIFVQNDLLLKICVLPEDVESREIESALRYTLMKMKTSVNDDYQEFVDVVYESDSPLDFEKVVFDKSRMKKMLSC